MPDVEEPKKKPWWKSRTFWGAVFLFVPEVVVAIGTGDPKLIVEAITKALGGITGAIGIRGAILRAGDKSE